MMTFGEWLRIELTKEDKTMSWMAKRLGVGPSVLTRWRTGTNPRTEHFLKVCVILADTQKKPINGILESAAKTIGVKIHVHKGDH